MIKLTQRLTKLEKRLATPMELNTLLKELKYHECITMTEQYRLETGRYPAFSEMYELSSDTLTEEQHAKREEIKARYDIKLPKLFSEFY